MADRLPKWVENLIADLQGSDHGVRRGAATRLGMWGKRDERVVAALQAAYQNDPDQRVRAVAAEALAGLGLPIAQEPVRDRVSEASPPLPPVPEVPPLMPNDAFPGSPQHALALERRLMYLEMESQRHRGMLSVAQPAMGAPQRPLPHTALLSDSFLSRAFAVWGHYFVAQLMIAIPIYCIIFLITSSGY